jgi:hypothetical protein
VPDDARCPTDSGSHQQVLAVRKKLKYLDEVDLNRV